MAVVDSRNGGDWDNDEDKLGLYGFELNGGG